MLNKILSGVLAGILVSIGGTIFLSCESKVVGAVLFSVALLCICIKGYSLFTGKIGLIPEQHDKEAVTVLLTGLCGNLIGTVLCGLCLRYALTIGASAETLCAAKLTQAPLATFVRAIFCGILMYLAVATYREGKTFAGIFFCIPVFILSGFEHSIADMFYFSAAAMFSAKVWLFLLIVLCGNTVGGMLFPVFGMIGKRR